MSDDIILGWHFLSDDGTAFGGYRPPDIGMWEPPIDDPAPCLRGYHGSPTILKALKYATGPILGRCEYRGVVWHGDRDKWAARERRCIARVDASLWLRFAAAHIAERATIRAGVTDERCHEAIRVARRFALGGATAEELHAAYAAANAAANASAYAAYASANASAYASARVAAYAAYAANASAYAANASAYASAYAAANASARVAANAAYAAANAAANASAYDAAYDAAWADEEQWLEEAALDLDCAPLFSVHPTR